MCGRRFHHNGFFLCVQVHSYDKEPNTEVTGIIMLLLHYVTTYIHLVNYSTGCLLSVRLHHIIIQPDCQPCRQGSVEVECCLLAQCMQEPSPQVINTVMNTNNFIAKQSHVGLQCSHTVWSDCIVMRVSLWYNLWCRQTTGITINTDYTTFQVPTADVNRPGYLVTPSDWGLLEFQFWNSSTVYALLISHYYSLMILFASTGALQVMVITPVNSTTVTVSWSEVQCFNESGAVTHYLVQYQSLCGGAVQNVTTSGLIQNVLSLTPNCVYTFQVAAVGASRRIGPFSKLANVYLPGACMVSVRDSPT